MNDRTVPHDLAAEESLLGSMMLTKEALRRGADLLTVEDFYKPAHQVIFLACRALFMEGLSCDPVTVAARLREQGDLDQVGGQSALMHIQAATPASVNAVQYANIVLDRAERRRFMALGGDIGTYAQDLTVPVDVVTDMVREGLTGAMRGTAERRFKSFEDWRGDVDMTENWIVPEVFERRDRAVVVAGEGVGKSFWLRQLALMTACGLHWFTERRMMPHPVIVFDVENSDRQLVRNTNRMYQMAQREVPGFNAENFAIIPYGTLDLSRRSDRLDVESYIAGHRPSLIVIGPLYKILPAPGGKLSYEEQAQLGFRIIDDWRARYDVAVLIEHHAPQAASGSSRRDLRPLGSSALMRWPEFGLTLEPDTENPKFAALGHFRAPREQRAWPKTLERGTIGQWPWRCPASERTDQEKF